MGQVRCHSNSSLKVPPPQAFDRLSTDVRDGEVDPGCLGWCSAALAYSGFDMGPLQSNVAISKHFHG